MSIRCQGAWALFATRNPSPKQHNTAAERVAREQRPRTSSQGPTSPGSSNLAKFLEKIMPDADPAGLTDTGFLSTAAHANLRP